MYLNLDIPAKFFGNSISEGCFVIVKFSGKKRGEMPLFK